MDEWNDEGVAWELLTVSPQKGNTADYSLRHLV